MVEAEVKEDDETTEGDDNDETTSKHIFIIKY